MFQDGISLDRMDNTTCMMVIAKLDKLGPNGDGTYYCEQRLEVGLNIGEFHDCLNAGVQGGAFAHTHTMSWFVTAVFLF